jgi:hypothetical protein
MSLKTKLFIKENLLENKKELDYVLKNALSKVDQGSQFEEKNKDYLSSLKKHPKELIKILGSQGYDIMLGYDNENLIGHMAFQEHNNSQGIDWEMFHLYVNPKERNKNYSLELSLEFLEKAKENKANIRLGAGGHPIMKKIIEKIQKKYNGKLKIQDHWIFLR